MNKLAILPILIFISIVTCSQQTNSSDSENRKILLTHQKIKGADITLEITKGENWYGKIPGYSGIIVPQMAIWIEDTKGNYIETLYVSHKFAKQKWYGNVSYTEDETFRTSSIPYWLNKLKRAGKNAPTKKNPLPDTITGATPTTDFTLKSKLSVKQNKYTILAEFSNSYDFNSFYTHEDTQHRGQPSIIWAGQINLKEKKKTTFLKIIGHGSLNGNDGKLYRDLNNLTTAKKIIKEIKVSLE